MEKRIIAAFDFDGTITTKDTLFDFIAFYHGKPKLILGLLLVSPILVLFKLKMLSNEFAKRTLLTLFFKGVSVEKLDDVCIKYIERVNQILIPDAITKLKWHQEQGHKVIIISASIDRWIKPWAKSRGIDEFYSTQLEIIDGQISGRFATPNCHGKEKVNRFLAAYPNREEYTLYVYGDSNGDKNILEIADYSFYRKYN